MRQVDQQAVQADPGTSRTVGGSPSPVLFAAGNQAAARLADAQPQVFAQLSGLGTVVGAVTGFFGGQELEGSVGVKGVNDPHDVATVTRMLMMAGYVDLDIDAAITRFQTEVVKLPHPDGRVDRNGRTFKALKRLQPKDTGKSSRSWDDMDIDPSPAPAAPAAPAPVAPAAPGGTSDVMAVEAQVRALEAQAEKVPQSDDEEIGKQRDELVAGIHKVRAAVAGVADPEKKAEFYRRLNAVAPFYTQGKNANLTVRSAVAATCNVTAVAMCLEQLGLDVKSYKGDRREVERIAKWTGAGTDLDALRLPDFLQLAAIAEHLNAGPEPTTAEFQAAQGKAANWIGPPNGLRTLFLRFGVKTTLIPHPQRDILVAVGKANTVDSKHIRAGIDKRERDAKNDPSTATIVEAGHSLVAKPGGGHKVEEVELEGYKKWVKDKFEPILNAGRPVVVAQFNHWMRLEAINDDYVTIDDPGWVDRGNRKFAWEEARAVGMFERAIAVDG